MESRIVLAREYAGMNQKELAQKLGISPSTLNGYEKGNHDPKSAGLIGISKACGVTTDYLLGLSDSMKINDSKISPELDKIMVQAQHLNNEGLSKLSEYADDLASSGKYEKVHINERAI